MGSPGVHCAGGSGMSLAPSLCWGRGAHLQRMVAGAAGGLQTIPREKHRRHWELHVVTRSPVVSCGCRIDRLPMVLASPLLGHMGACVSQIPLQLGRVM